jgi:phosphocarrier protein HPr
VAAREETVILVNKVGLHARPASAFVQTAARFASTIQVRCDGRVADAKRILQVLQLGAERGAALHIVAEGPDAAEAVAALRELVAGRFGEPE